MGFSYPSTLSETGSDQHRNYLARLCCVFRLLRPPDALFRPQPLPPCFVRVAPLGFQPTEVFPPRKRGTSRDALSLRAVSRQTPRTANHPTRHDAAAPRVCAIEKSVPADTVLPDEYRPILSWPLPLRGFHPSGLDFMLPRSLLSWAFTSRCAASRPS
jgi:hypothetical protein